MKCEWNPLTNQPILNNDLGHAEATWNLNKGGWYLCDECAKLNLFNHYKKRSRIEKPPIPMSELPEL